MTREEAIKWVERIKEKYIHGGDEGFDEARRRALDMAIEALSADAITHEIRTETHECVSETHDLISRERTLRAINGYLETIPYIRNTLTDVGRRDATIHCLYIISELPSAEAVSQSEQYKKGFEDAKRAFLVEYARERENMRKQNAQLDGWILCSERLPKKEDFVIVTILDEHGDTPYRYTDFGWYLKGANCWVVDAEQRTDVTAWMPLPEPYKEDSE